MSSQHHKNLRSRLCTSDTEVRCRSRVMPVRWGLALLLAAVQLGCANTQMVRWTAPTDGPKSQPTNLDPARAYADAARKAYQDAVAAYSQTQGSVSDALLGLGALGTALAVAKVHRDALLGTAFIGGTAYAYGNLNLSKQRALVHLEGVNAINCAKRAISPLAMTTVEQASLESALTTLDAGLIRVNNARAQVRLAITPQIQAMKAEMAATDAAMSASSTATEMAQRAMASGRQLATGVRGAGDRLIQTVDKIDALVTRASLDTLPDLTALPKVIGGLSGFAAGVVPGAGIDTLINGALADRAKAAGAKSQAGKARVGDDALAATSAAAALKALDTATDALAEATDLLLAAAANVQARLLGHESALVADALRDCGVLDVAFALRASSDKLSFAGGAAATKSLVLSGGTKPYVVELQDSPAEGLTVKSPAPFETRVQVAITDKTPKQTFSLLVMDSSNPMKTVTVMIEVGQSDAKVTAGSALQPTVDATSTVTTLPALADQLTKAGSFKADNAIRLSLTSEVVAAIGATTLVAKVKCEPKPASADKRITALRARDILVFAVAPNASLDLTSKLTVTGPADCIVATP